jgi:hypothetical protein
MDMCDMKHMTACPIIALLSDGFKAINQFRYYNVKHLLLKLGSKPDYYRFIQHKKGAVRNKAAH